MKSVEYVLDKESYIKYIIDILFLVQNKNKIYKTTMAQ